MLTGIDISSHQRWLSLHNIQTDFCIIKATGGTQYINDCLPSHWKQAKAKNLLTGLYHFVHETGCQGTAQQEAQHFINTVRPYLDGKTILAIDNEANNKKL